MRILNVIDCMNLAGAQSFIMNLYNSIDNNNVQFDFLVDVEKHCFYDDKIKELGGKIYYSPRYKIYNHFQYCKWLDGYFKEHKEYKIIHCHQYNIASVCLKVAKENGLKTICHSHSSKSDVGLKGIVKSFYRKNINKVTDYAFACSNNAGKYLYGSREFKVINNCIDSKKYIFNDEVRNKIRQNLNIHNNSMVLGHVGSFREVKNHKFLIEIFKEYNKINSNSYLLLIGVGSLLNDIKNKVNELGLQNKVLFLGSCGNVNEILQAFDVFVFPSIYEGLPVSVIEAQASGLKCLISDKITDEVVLSTDLVKKLSIDKGILPWINELKNIQDYKRLNMSECIINSGYDVNDVTKKLIDFYFGLI